MSIKHQSLNSSKANGKKKSEKFLNDDNQQKSESHLTKWDETLTMPKMKTENSPRMIDEDGKWNTYESTFSRCPCPILTTILFAFIYLLFFTLFSVLAIFNLILNGCWSSDSPRVTSTDNRRREERFAFVSQDLSMVVDHFEWNNSKWNFESLTLDDFEDELSTLEIRAKAWRVAKEHQSDENNVTRLSSDIVPK